MRCFQCLAKILHFVNPAVWAANRMINRLREFACDDMALALGRGSRLESGEAFLGVVRYAASVERRAEVKFDAAIGVFESTARASCFQRMRRLLDPDRRLRVRLGLGSVCVLLLTAALALPQLRAADPTDTRTTTAGETAAKADDDKKSHSTATGAPGKPAASSQTSGGGTEKSPAAAVSQRRFELVVLGPDKEPVPGALVEIRGNMLSPEAKKQACKGYRGNYFRTGENGSLVLAVLPRRGCFIVLIETPGFGPFWGVWVIREPSEAAPRRFTVELEAGWSVGGIIVDEQGKPQQGVTVNPSIEFRKVPGDRSQLVTGSRVTTDAAGRWRYDCVPVSMKDVFVAINHPSFKPLRRSLARDAFGLDPGEEPAAKIALERGLVITGRVTDEAGKPIAGALVRTKFLNDIRQAKTDEKGVYHLVGCEPRTARVVVSAKGRALDMKEVRVAPDLGPVDFQMKPGGKICVRVLDPQGKPAPRARIFFQEWRGRIDYFEFDHINQYADRNGVWEWNEAPLDEFKADICPPNGMQLVERPLQAREKEHVFHTYPKLVVSGSVVDAQTRKPIPSFQVVQGIGGDLEPDGDMHISWMRNKSLAAKDGRYRVEFDREYLAHLVRIEADGYQVAVSRELRSDEGKVSVDFALSRAKDVAATVLAPEGQPAAGAKIAVGVAGAQINVKNGDIQEGSTYATRHDADAAGRFHFPWMAEPFQLVIVHPSGFAWLKSAEQEIPDVIRLTPWARVEGTFRVGTRPAAHVTLELQSNTLHSYGNDVPRIFTEYRTVTDAQGRYVFERVTPGRGAVGRQIILMVRDGATEVTSSVRIVAEFPAGKTTRLDMGGTGRPVVGRLAPPPGFKEKALWQFATINVEVDVPGPGSPPVPPGIGNDPELYQDWWNQWEKTEEGKAWLAAAKVEQELRSAGPYIWATVDRDGAFRIDDVPPGSYLLNVRFSEHPVGHLSKHPFTVGPVEGGYSSEAVDLGRLTLTGD